MNKKSRLFDIDYPNKFQDKNEHKKVGAIGFFFKLITTDIQKNSEGFT